LPLRNAQCFYLARTYAYVADGLAFIDISNSVKPKLERLYNAARKPNDTRAVQIGSINASEFVLVADGKNGLQILQMISPENVPGYILPKRQWPVVTFKERRGVKLDEHQRIISDEVNAERDRFHGC